MRLFFCLVGVLLLSGCVTAKSWFIPPMDVTVGEKGTFTIKKPKDSIVILFTPGSSHNTNLDACRYAASTPDVLLDLAGETIGGKTVLVHGYCSIASGNLSAGMSKSEARAPDIEKMVQEYYRQGVPAKQIFVAGHSMGGWAAVLVGARKNVEIGGFIAFAPANGIWTYDRRTGDHWAAYDRQKRSVEGLDRLDGMAFLFEGDPYNSPKDLEFMKDIPGVHYIAAPKCSGTSAHRTASDYCFSSKYQKQIVRYIEQRVSDKNTLAGKLKQ